MNISHKLSGKYPWITFSLDLTRLKYQAWMLLGECASKCDHLRRVPITPEVQKRLHLIYLSKGVQATTAIEGNTLTEDEVRAILDEGKKMPKSKAYLEQEVRNIARACREIYQSVLDKSLPTIDVALLKQFNRYVLENVPGEDHVVPGKIRDHGIVVGNVYKGPDAADLKPLLEQFCDWINGNDFRDSKLDPLAVAILKAVTTHIYIAWIHPFSDGNGRTARLVEFNILLQAGVSSPAAHLLSNHYNITRNEYYRQLDAAGKLGGDTRPFTAYALQGFRDGLAEQLKFIYDQNIGVYWRNYIFEKFGEMKRSDRLRRQRELAITLAKHDEPLDKEQLLLVMAKYYAGKKVNTLSRDLDELVKMKLARRVSGRYISNKEYMLQYLPPAAGSKSTD